MSEQKENVMKLTVGRLISEIDPALAQLGSFAIKNMDALISIAKFRREVKKEITLYSELHKGITEVDCERDKNDQPILENISGRQMYKYSSPEKEMEVILRIKQLHEKEVELPITPIKASDLKNVDGISANMLEILEGFIVFD